MNTYKTVNDVAYICLKKLLKSELHHKCTHLQFSVVLMILVDC